MLARRAQAAREPVALPERLRAGAEGLSGVALDDVRVHYDSPEPGRLDALAYAQGTEIHLGPGQEEHLPHEAWHVVQQRQGRVRPTVQAKGRAVSDDAQLEREADVMGARAQTGPPAGPRAPLARVRTAAGVAIQRVKQPPLNNHLRYVNANLTNSAVTAGVHPDDAEVAAEGDFTGNSAPVNSHGWAALQPNAYALTNGAGGGMNTQITIDPRVDVNGNHLIRMHLIHHQLAGNANGNINNIVLGPHSFNMFHVNHVENFMGDSLYHNFYTSSNNTSLNAALVNGDATGIAPPAHANAGTPYVVGAAPTFPGGLRTGAILPANNGVPANARAISTDEATLDRFVTLWYFVQPIFGLNAGNVYTNLFNHLNNEYGNNRPASIQSAENIPAGIVGPGGMLQNMADAIAGIYVTALDVHGSFFTPEPSAIAPGGSTADQLPWRDNRIPKRRLTNSAGNPYALIQMTFDTGGMMANNGGVVLQL